LGELLDMCDQADAWWRRLASIDNPDAALVVGRALQKDGQSDAATPWLTRVAVSHSDHARDVLKELLDQHVRASELLDAATRRVAADDRWIEKPLMDCILEDNHWWQAAAAVGDTDAMICLGWASLRYGRRPGNRQEAEGWYRRAVAAAGDRPLLHRLGEELQLESPPERPAPQPPPSLNRLKNDFDKALSLGDLDKAQEITDLVRRIDEVAWQQWKRVPADPKEPMTCWKEGDAAQARNDPSQAADWYRRGAAAGTGWYSTFCADGLIQMGHRSEGKRELTRQAQCGGTASMSHLASLLLDEHDRDGARVWLSRAALAAAATITATSGDVMFEYADLLEADNEPGRARFWFAQSASAFELAGCAYLDVMQKADEWFEFAARAAARAERLE
jgi:hypothetical protein